MDPQNFLPSVYRARVASSVQRRDKKRGIGGIPARKSSEMERIYGSYIYIYIYISLLRYRRYLDTPGVRKCRHSNHRRASSATKRIDARTSITINLRLIIRFRERRVVSLGVSTAPDFASAHCRPFTDRSKVLTRRSSKRLRAQFCHEARRERPRRLDAVSVKKEARSSVIDSKGAPPRAVYSRAI